MVLGAAFIRMCGRSRRAAALLALLVAAFLLLAPQRARAFDCTSVYPGIATFGNPYTLGFNIYACAATASAGATTVVSANGPLSAALTNLLAGPNGGAVATALGSILGPGAISQSATVVKPPTFSNFGPTIVPYGNGPGGINCTGAPTVWPPTNCNMTGYQQLNIPADYTGYILDAHFIVSTTVNFGASNSAALNWVGGDLHTTVQTTMLDEEFDFIDGLLDRGGTAGTDAATGMPMQYAEASFSDDDPGSGDALAYARNSHFPALLKAPPPAQPDGIWTAWAKGEYGAGNFDGTASNFGFGYRSGGGEIGLDYRRGEWLLGVATDYEHANVNQDTSNDSAGIDSVRLAAYAGYRPGAWSFTTVLSGGYNGVSTDRLTILPTPATASYDAGSFNAAFEAAKRYDFWGGVVQPLAGLVYSNLYVGSFNEAGSPLDINGQSADVAALRGYVGARAWRSFDTAPGQTLTAEVHGRLFYDFLDDARALTASFAGDPTAAAFAVDGITPDRTSAVVGTALEYRFAPAWRAIASYDAELSSNTVAQHVSGGLRMNW